MIAKTGGMWKFLGQRLNCICSCTNVIAMATQEHSPTEWGQGLNSQPHVSATPWQELHNPFFHLPEHSSTVNKGCQNRESRILSISKWKKKNVLWLPMELTISPRKKLSYWDKWLAQDEATKQMIDMIDFRPSLSVSMFLLLKRARGFCQILISWALGLDS